ncbi:MAG: PDC sensor domain-containing protein [Thiohalomonadales bacterium]
MIKTTETLQQSILKQRDELAGLLKAPMKTIAHNCSIVWNQRDPLNQVLLKALEEVPHVKYLYVLDTQGIQISDNIGQAGIIERDFARDRRHRPYMRAAISNIEFLLSDAYISLRAQRPSLTAIQVVRDKHAKQIGFLGADFDLRNLPLTRPLYVEPHYWQQIKGDPSIRSAVFNQSRVDSVLDQHIDIVMSVVEELMTRHGVFHAKLHYSSSRAVIWLHDDPYRYRLLDIDALIDPNICLAYPRGEYPKDALVPEHKIAVILAAFKTLRQMDDTLYLRSSTLNIFNGVIGLTFSCDGSHYIPYEEFLDKDHAFWSH